MHARRRRRTRERVYPIPTPPPSSKARAFFNSSLCNAHFCFPFLPSRKSTFCLPNPSVLRCVAMISNLEKNKEKLLREKEVRGERLFCAVSSLPHELVPSFKNTGKRKVRLLISPFGNKENQPFFKHYLNWICKGNRVKCAEKSAALGLRCADKGIHYLE